MDIEQAVRRVAAIAARLPETREQDAWVGVRWRVRTRTFAHVFPAADDKPLGSAAHAGTRAPSVLLVFHATPSDAETYERLGPPFFKPPWSPTVVGLRIEETTDWDEVAELLTDSWVVSAPQRLARVVLDQIDESGAPPGSAPHH